MIGYTLMVVLPMADMATCLIWLCFIHYGGVIMSRMASQITSLTIVCPNFYSGADQRKHHSSASLAFVRGIHRRSVNYPHKGPVMRKMFPFDYIIMCIIETLQVSNLPPTTWMLILCCNHSSEIIAENIFRLFGDKP